MVQKKFASLLERYCSHNGIDSSEKIVLGAPLLINDVAISLRHDDDAIQELAYAYCDLGLLAAGEEKVLMRRLLLANLDIHFAGGQCLMISPATGHVLLAQAFDTGLMTPEGLGHILLALVSTAQNWRDTRFAGLLDNTPALPDPAFVRRAASERSRFAQIPHQGGAAS